MCVYSYEAHVTDQIEQHESVCEAKSVVQQPSYCTLEDCFQLYTRDERVDTLSPLFAPHICCCCCCCDQGLLSLYLMGAACGQ